MAGAFRLALSRATVEVRDREGRPTSTLPAGTVTLRDGVARLRVGSSQVAELAAAELQRLSSRAYTIMGADGTSWYVTKDCGCGGGRR